ncbi:hypothetical protein ACOSQ4_020852 [Xanthoceras sorbifolium]
MSLTEFSLIQGDDDMCTMTPRFKFSYKKQLIYEGQFASCCKSYPISCWQHCIQN